MPRELKALDPPAEASPFDEITVETRSGTFRFRELNGEDYDKCVKLSTDEKSDLIDSVMLLRWMAIKSSIEPELSAEKLGKLPMKVRSEVLSRVNELHFPDGPDLERAADELRRAGWTVSAPIEEADSPNS